MTERRVLEQVGEILGCIGAFTPQDVIDQAGQVRRSADRMATEYHRAEAAEAELKNLRAEGAALVSAVQRAILELEDACDLLQDDGFQVNSKRASIRELEAVVARLAGGPHPK